VDMVPCAGQTPIRNLYKKLMNSHRWRWPLLFLFFSLSIVGDLVTASPGLQLCTYSSLINESDTILSTFWPHQDKLPDDTCEDDHDHKEEEEVDDEEPFNPTRPPPRWPHRDDQ
jgi:hypothetical protein